MDAAEDRDYPQLRRLLAVIERLRAPGGCPWDREQTEASMAPHLLEEAYEAVDAIQGGQPGEVCEELGDVLMNVLMIAQIGSEHDRFGIEDVARTIADKLVRRHPHVFGGVKVDGSEEVLQNWEAIKRDEKGDGAPRSVLAGVPPDLPALLRAYRIGEKAARVGFDWPDAKGPRAKIDEELAELDAALATGDRQAVEHELGDVLFSLVNLARHHGVEPETALRGTIARFAHRFRIVEERLGGDLADAGLEALEQAWQEAKDAGPPS